MIAPIIQGLERGPTIAGIETTKPPWPIYFIVSVENILGPETMLTVPLVVFLMLLVFPYLVEKMSVSKEKKAQLGVVVFYLGLFVLIGVSYWLPQAESLSISSNHLARGREYNF
jgi:hypothetical protein